MLLLKYLCAFALLITPLSSFSCTFSMDPNRIDIIGDSHTTQAFGVELEKNLEQALNGSPVNRFAVAGSTAGAWAAPTNSILRSLTIRSYCPGDGDIQGAPPSPKFPNASLVFAQNPPPKAYIIALGTNDIAAKCKLPAEQQMLDIQALLQELPASSTCVWVGPATMTSGDIVTHCGLPAMQDFYQELQSTLSKYHCAFVDSRIFTAPAGLEQTTALDQTPKTLQDCLSPTNKILEPNNGFHFAGALAHFWGDCVALKVQEFLHAVPSDTSTP